MIDQASDQFLGPRHGKEKKKKALEEREPRADDSSPSRQARPTSWKTKKKVIIRVASDSRDTWTGHPYCYRKVDGAETVPVREKQ